MKSTWCIKMIAAVIALALLAGAPAVAQVLKGSISGTVSDPQGAVVSGAEVKVTQSDTGTVYITQSDSSGLFRISLIPAGTYKVEISTQNLKASVSLVEEPRRPLFHAAL